MKEWIFSFPFKLNKNVIIEWLHTSKFVSFRFQGNSYTNENIFSSVLVAEYLTKIFGVYVKEVTWYLTGNEIERTLE